MRVTREQKRRIQRLAKKKGESVSTLLLRALESAEKLPPRENPKAAALPVIRFCLESEATQGEESTERAEAKAEIELSEAVKAFAE